LTDPEEVDLFLAGGFELDNPFRLLGMSQAVTRVRQAIEKEEPIVVYGDFDADGVTATALLVLTLRALGAQAHPYIPHRVDEGYGLNQATLTELAQQGARLVITVDCGIRSPDEAAHAQKLGMDVILTDHHTLGPRVPEATAILNPRQPDCPYPEKHLTGVGLAYKLAQGLLRSNRQVPVKGEAWLKEEDLLDLVALGTVTDLAPLRGENRQLVMQGLERMNTSPRPGIAQLMRRARIELGSVNASTIGYVLGPRLNAAGRIAHAKLAYQLLTTQYPGEAERLAQQLDDLNRERQQLTAEAVERARQLALEEDDGTLLFVADSDFPAGVVGLVANRLMDEFYRPAVVIEQGEETSRGSARSIPEFHITHALEACSPLLLRYGGHRAAAGLTVYTRDLPELKDRLIALATRELEGQELRPILDVDAEVPLGEMDGQLQEDLEGLRPFGRSNPDPVFVSRGVQVRHYRAVGNDGAHLKMLLSGPGICRSGLTSPTTCN
jgi:single-stranded-DNA-specific exonuclease